MDEFVLALLKCKKIGSTKAYEFIKENKFDIDKMKLNLEKFVGSFEFNNFNRYLKEANEEIKKNRLSEINIITLLDDRFPTKLYNTSDPILYLYYKGNIDLLNDKSIAVIGTRHPTEKSIELTKRITKEIVDNGYVVIGGLALGIDSVGHQTSIDNHGKTIAVLPTGLDNIQPSSNKKLANEILNNNGCLISEYSVGTTLNTFNFAKRDRIQTALANAIFVGEANEKSGTMIAVNKAIKENISVFQFATNENKIIKNNIDVNCGNIDEMFNSADNNYKNEISKSEIINEKCEEQISLF